MITENEEEAILLKSNKNEKVNKSVNSNNTENNTKNSENVQGKNIKINAKSTYELYKLCQEVTANIFFEHFCGKTFFLFF